MDARQRASRVRLMAFDIDGVMTDGGLTYTDDGREQKTFNVMDGLGLKLLQRAGIELAIVTGRQSGVVAARAADLGIRHVFQGNEDKRTILASLAADLGLHWPDLGYMGDDIIDLPALRMVGFAVAPANAHPLVKEHAHAITDARGGQGAVREVAEFLLNAQGRLETLLSPYLADA